MNHAVQFQNDLNYLRVRAKKHEIMVAFGQWTIWVAFHFQILEKNIFLDTLLF